MNSQEEHKKAIQRMKDSHPVIKITLKPDWPLHLDKPEQMLARWETYPCRCDPSVGFLCERCHDLAVIRILLQERK